METIPTTRDDTKDKAATAASVGVICDFKLPADKRTIQFATDEEADAAFKWVLENYSPALAELAK
ncbi:MAG: hypothetical protein ACAI35_09190 [Candidatus Methylacidiphilales bacterium]|nr:hypothetical protein [Candidatus Methylacidiphilales bacterium]